MHLFLEDISKHARVTQKVALPNLRQELFLGTLSPPPIGVWVAKSQLRALATHTPIWVCVCLKALSDPCLFACIF